ncbi:tyrosine recombinase XerC [Streptomyces sp. Da 82-17]|uniref:site-specific integrase n=1 Tax=Streptomyces sp. Da 82-17 TaxID=3377116 RepID=UPI0038D51577
MEPADLLDDWLNTSALRPSTRAEYRREIGFFLTWCTRQNPPLDALTARPKDIAAWAAEWHLAPYLNGRTFDGPDALAALAQQHPEAARSHDRRISALTQFYEAARGHITLPPNLTALRSGVGRPAGAKNKLDRMERAVLFSVIGSWGAAHSRHWQRDQLIVFLLLEGLRPAEVVRVNREHLYPQPDGTWEVRAPDQHENVGRKFTLEPLTGAALKAYLDVRPEPADPGETALLLNDRRQPLQSRFPNLLVGQMTATHPLLADRHPPVTADTIAHTGFWDTPDPVPGPVD